LRLLRRYLALVADDEALAAPATQRLIASARPAPRAGHPISIDHGVSVDGFSACWLLEVPTMGAVR
jgi:hypothetical protein